MVGVYYNSSVNEFVLYILSWQPSHFAWL